AVERSTNFGDEFERSIHLVLCSLNRICILKPWELLGSRTEGISTCSTERMPVSNCKTKMFFHRLLTYLLLRIIEFKSQRVITFLPFELDLANTFEVFFVAECEFHIVTILRFKFQVSRFKVQDVCRVRVSRTGTPRHTALP